MHRIAKSQWPQTIWMFNHTTNGRDAQRVATYEQHSHMFSSSFAKEFSKENDKILCLS
jgi:hypothetical protein